jgi:hypothetical protein
MANSPAKLAELNANIDNFKTRTGLDPRTFEQIALGVRYTYPTEGITKLITAGLAKGTFNAGAMVAAGRLASNGKYREEKYQGKSVYIFTLDESIKLFGVIDLKLRELAASPIDVNPRAPILVAIRANSRAALPSPIVRSVETKPGQPLPHCPASRYNSRLLEGA